MDFHPNETLARDSSPHVDSRLPPASDGAGLLGRAAGRLALRIHGSDRNGQVVRIAGQKCSIGAAAACTFRLRGIAAAPLNCLILRSDSATAVRRWSADTRLNGDAFSDAPLYLGDRLAIGSLELEVIEGAPSRQRAEAFSSEQAAPRSDMEEAWRRRVEELQTSLDRVRQQRDSLLAERLNFDAKQEELTAEIARRGDDLRRTEMLWTGERRQHVEAAEKATAEIAEREAAWKDSFENQLQQIEALTQERDSSHLERDRLDRDCQRLSSERQELELRHRELQAERDALGRQRDAWLRERAVLESGRLALATEMAALSEAQSVRAQGASELDAAKVALEGELARLREERQLEQTTWNEERARITEAATGAQARLETLAAEAADRSVLEADLARQNHERQTEQASWNDERASLQETIARLEARAAEAADKSVLEADLARQIHERQTEQASWNDERASLQETIARLEARAAEAADKSPLEAELARLNLELHSQQASWSDERAKLIDAAAEREKQATQEAEQVRRQLGEAYEENDALQRERDSLAVQRNASMLQRESLAEEVARLTADIDALTARLARRVAEPAGADADSSPLLSPNECGEPTIEREAPEEMAHENVSGTYILPEGFAGFTKTDSPAFEVETPSLFAPEKAPEVAGEAMPSPDVAPADEPAPLSIHEAVRPISFTEPLASPLASLPAQAEEESEESIEDYMQRLLMRARGEQAPLSRTTGSGPVAAAPSAAPARTPNQPSPAAAAPPSAPVPGAEQEYPVGATCEYNPRSTAPEQASHLAAMREVANTTTRSAIDHSHRKRGVAENWAKLGMGVGSIAASAWLGIASGGRPNLSMLGAFAGAIGGAFWLSRAGSAFWKRRQESKPSLD